MKNTGLGELVLVAPRTRIGAVGERMAAHARDLLARRRLVADLPGAVADCHLVVGTVGRDTTGPEQPRTARALAPEILAAARHGRVALVFGPEDHGLANRELDLCQRWLRIPSAPEYPSLNLAQAVAICGYELLLATEQGASKESLRREARYLERAATSAEREALLDHLAVALGRIGFLSRENPTHILRDVRSLFARAGLTTRDVRIWRGVARQILWAASRAAASAAPGGPSSSAAGAPPAPTSPRGRRRAAARA